MNRLMCLLTLRDGGEKIIRGYLLGWVPKRDGVSEFTVDALVELVTFDCGAVRQIPFMQITLVDQWNDLTSGDQL